jgi:hypothetical protein
MTGIVVLAGNWGLSVVARKERLPFACGIETIKGTVDAAPFLKFVPERIEDEAF